jgi:hypothetical protein
MHVGRIGRMTANASDLGVGRRWRSAASSALCHPVRACPVETSARQADARQRAVSQFFEMLTRLIYASHARSSCLDDVPGILEWSRNHNPGLGITGVLCLLDDTYMQYLEGDERAVMTLFESIRQDGRHRGATVLDRREIPRRSYPDWFMALLQWDDRTRAIFRSFSPGQNLDLYASDPSTAAPLVRALTRDAAWKFVP